MPTATETQIPEPKRAASEKTVGRLFFLDASVGGRVVSVNADGSDRKVIVNGCRIPDGIVVDLEAGRIYWTNMGVPSDNDGSIERADLDGQNRRTIIANGETFTPKQLHLEKTAGKLYWCDREGMCVMRCNLDGSNVETLVDPSWGDTQPGRDATKWCVGIAVDPHQRQIYWTQKGPDNGRLLRANIDIPKGENAANRTDIEVLFDGLPEPIDLELDLKKRSIYWTDRGDPPPGNTVNRAAMNSDSGGPGLRWGVMGQSLQWHLGGGAGGINHFMDHLMTPLEGMMKILGTPNVTPELKQKVINGVMREAAGRSVDQLAQEENRVLIGLLKLRAATASTKPQHENQQ